MIPVAELDVSLKMIPMSRFCCHLVSFQLRESIPTQLPSRPPTLIVAKLARVIAFSTPR